MTSPAKSTTIRERKATSVHAKKLWKSRMYFDLRYVPIERRRSYRLAFILFGSILMYFFVHTHVISFDMLVEQSMHPTLSERQSFLVNRWIYRFSKPHRGDVVALRTNQHANEEYVKRIIGLAGELLSIRGGSVYIDGRQLQEPYAVGDTYPSFGPRLIPKGYYFVMGDNRMRSEDSRAFGPIAHHNIRGRILQGPETYLRK